MIKSTKVQRTLHTMLLYVGNIVFLSPIMIFGGQNFSIDSYNVLLSAQDHTTSFVGSYRWFGAFLYRAYLATFGHNPILDSTIDSFLFILASAVVFLTLSISIYRLIADKSILTYFAINLSVVLTVLNVWFCNILSFPECIFITTIAVILCFGAIIIFLKIQTIKGCVLSAILIVLATGVYQQFLFVFTIYVIAICSIDVFKKDEITFAELFKRYIKPIILIFVSGAIYFTIAIVVQKALGVNPIDRTASGLSKIYENIIYYATHQHSYIKGRGYFDSEIMTVCFLTIFIVWLTAIFIEWLKNKNTLKTVVVCASFICGYVSAYATVLISEAHSLRGLFPLFSIFALFTIGSLGLIKKGYTVKVGLCAVLITALVANAVVSVKNEINLKKQNDVDQSWSEQIIEEIKKYEKDGQEIKQIYYCYDDNIDLSEYEESAVCYNYSLRSMLNFYSSRNLKIIEMPFQEKTIYFKDKNWNNINVEEQLVFVNDSLYLCCY